MIDLVPLKHREAIEYFRSKGYAPALQRFSHLDVWREEHARNFVVAKALRDDVLQLIRGELERAMDGGRTLKQFQDDLAPALQRAGWWGESVMQDPVTGDWDEVKLGSMRRLRVIYDTNMRTAHAAGHWARIQRTKSAFPYLQYVQVERPSKRHDHARFHDKIWPVDHPIWQRIYPPNGYFCGCHVIQRTEGWMKRRGRQVSDAVDLDEQPWTHKRSGEIFDVPRGVHPGFDVNPGAAWLDIQSAVDEIMPDLSPERRAHERGLLQGLRLRRYVTGRETLIVSNVDGDEIAMMDAPVDQLGVVSVDAAINGREDFRSMSISLLHSHITDAPLSHADIMTLKNPRVRSISAISPGGAIWRARPGREVFGVHASNFARRAYPILHDMDLSDSDYAYITHHAFALYLDRAGVIYYNYSLTERLKQLFAKHAALIERLIE